MVRHNIIINDDMVLQHETQVIYRRLIITTNKLVRFNPISKKAVVLQLKMNSNINF